jgi:hypothetical protein
MEAFIIVRYFEFWLSNVSFLFVLMARGKETRPRLYGNELNPSGVRDSSFGCGVYRHAAECGPLERRRNGILAT